MISNIINLLNDCSSGFNKLIHSNIPVLVSCWRLFIDLYKAIAENHKRLCNETNCICSIYCLSKWPMKHTESAEIVDYMSSLFCRYFV